MASEPIPRARRRSRASPAPGVGPDALEQPLRRLAGVGPARAASLARAGLESMRDLVLAIPQRLVLWPAAIPIAAARSRSGESVRVGGRISAVRLSRHGRRSTLRVRVEDESGTIDALFFNQPWLREQVVVGEEVELHGRVVAARGAALAAPRLGRAARPLPAPQSLVAAYRSEPGVGQELMRTLVARALAATRGAWREPLASAVLERHDLAPLPRAVEDLHRPRSQRAWARARRRIVLEGLIGFQARLHLRRRGAARPAVLRVVASGDATAAAEPLGDVPAALASAWRALGAPAPTQGQVSALREIGADLAGERSMHRLLQGDVGCGKTLVLAAAALAVARAGAQVAFLAPTEVLAEQHHAELAARLAAAGAACALLTSSLGRTQRRAVERDVAAGRVAVAFGTHALLSRSVSFGRLALAVVDEQQRFGVSQRLALVGKGEGVHLLLATATPIPRTLALTLYGDLDVSLIPDFPPGRAGTRTRWLRGAQRRRLLPFLRERLLAGESAFWVCPRLASTEGDAAPGASSEGAERRYAALSRGPLADFGIELVHGRLSREDRAPRLDRFRAGQSRLLVATTVIEVGVDVPAATVLVVEGAERLGLAQLHQLRGRVGRGPRDAWCLLLAPDEAAERMRLLERESDGFTIAEADLRQRGKGELAGLRQSGKSTDGLGGGEQDLDLLFLARDLVREDPGLGAGARRNGDPAIVG